MNMDRYVTNTKYRYKNAQLAKLGDVGIQIHIIKYYQVQKIQKGSKFDQK